jgi:hypothetical protein
METGSERVSKKSDKDGGKSAGKDGGKSGKKDSQLILRLDKADRDAFVALCKEMDTSAAREIRAFIRSYVKTHGKG